MNTMLDIPDDAICRRCRYSLRGLTRAVCPECGAAFDPGDSRSFLRTVSPRGTVPRRMGRLIFGVCYCILTYTTGVLVPSNWFVSALLKGPGALLAEGMTGILLGGAALVLCGLSFCGSAIAPRPLAIGLCVSGILVWHGAGLFLLCAQSST